MDELREAQNELAELARDEDGERRVQNERADDLESRGGLLAHWGTRMTDAKPFPKSQQLARGPKRHHRFVAKEKQWQVLAQTKSGPCRVCLTSASNGRVYSKIQLHHVIARAQGGDDFADNLVPVCPDCHRLLHNREPEACRALCASLTDAEYAYAVTKMGEAVFERVYGVTYGR